MTEGCRRRRRAAGWPGLRHRRATQVVFVFAAAALSAACGGSGATAPTPAQSSGPRPNVVVILADDMAYGLVGATRRFSFLQLPNLDRLATGGVQFDNAFVTTS